MRKIDTSLIVRLCLPQFAVGLFTTMLNNYLIYFYQPSKESGIPNLIPQGRIVLGILTIIGLIKAIDNFDSTLGVKFSTYAVPMIIGEIRRYLRDNNSIRVSRSLKDTAYKAIYAKDTLTRKNLKEPTVEEIAAEVGISKEDIVYALDAMQNPMSLYEPVYTDGGDTLYVMDQISDKKNKEEMWVEHLSLSEAMKRLNDRERHIISLRFFEGKTQTEVADMIGISQAQVSRLEKNALKAMRGYLTA